MRESAALAARHSVVVGAHPGYPDLLGFGRRELGATPREVADYVAYQVLGDGPVDLVFVPPFASHCELAWEIPEAARMFRRLASFSRLILAQGVEQIPSKLDILQSLLLGDLVPSLKTNFTT